MSHRKPPHRPGGFRKEPPRRPGRKALQLCKQVSHVLTYLLGECRDEVLQSLYVDRVEPAPDDKRLLVTVQLPADAPPPDNVLARLFNQIGFFRSEIAAEIHRKRVPELAFRCIPHGVSLEPTQNDSDHEEEN